MRDLLLGSSVVFEAKLLVARASAVSSEASVARGERATGAGSGEALRRRRNAADENGTVAVAASQISRESPETRGSSDEGREESRMDRGGSVMMESRSRTFPCRMRKQKKSPEDGWRISGRTSCLCLRHQNTATIITESVRAWRHGM